MTVRSRSFRLLLAALVAVAAAACDSSEDPYLLNPPAPDSTLIRMVNLAGSGSIDASVGPIDFVTAVPSFHVSPYKSLVLTERTTLQMTREGRLDTFENIQLSAGTKITYFVLPNDTSKPILLTKQTGIIDRESLLSRRASRIVLVNGIREGSLLLREGCQSGDTVISPLRYGTSSEREVPEGDISLYLYGADDTTLNGNLMATARLNLTAGTVYYLMAANRGTDTAIYVLSSEDGVMRPLDKAEPETRSEAMVEVLNAVADGTSISAHIAGASSEITTGLPAMTLSPVQTVQACYDPNGDSLVVTGGSGASTVMPLSLSVGRRSMIVVYGVGAGIRSLLLDRSAQTPGPRDVLIRGVNISSGTRGASIALGGGTGAADSIAERPFGTLAPGNASRYVRFLADSTYSFLMTDAQTGEYLDGGFQTLPSGVYTLFIINEGERRTLRLLRDDMPGSGLVPLQIPGNSAQTFNMISDEQATFSIGSVTLPPLAYSYVRSTIVPFQPVGVSVNGKASTTLDGTQGSYTIGATGSGADLRIIAFPAPTTSPKGSKAAVRFLNAVTDPAGQSLIVKNDITTLATADYGVPTPSTELDERKYSFVVITPGDSATVARIDGVELTQGRNYLLVIGPRLTGESSPSTSLNYGVLWMQE